jgi:hypothetical protein
MLFRDFRTAITCAIQEALVVRQTSTRAWWSDPTRTPIEMTIWKLATASRRFG